MAQSLPNNMGADMPKQKPNDAEIHWAEPPPRVGRLRGPRISDKIRSMLRENPGRFALLGTYANHKCATARANNMRGEILWVGFDIQVRGTEIYVAYVGDSE